MFGAFNTMLFTPGHATTTGPHIRDSIDMKRFMGIVIFALIPSILVGSYNVGIQAGVVGLFAAFMFGFLKLLPIIVVTYAVGLGWEMIFGHINGHDIHEGFLVTGILLPLTLPPTIPLWQVAVAEGTIADLNTDGIVDFNDFAIFADDWMWQAPWH